MLFYASQGSQTPSVWRSRPAELGWKHSPCSETSWHFWPTRTPNISPNKKNTWLSDIDLKSDRCKLHKETLYTVYMYQCCPQHSGQIEKCRVEKTTPGGVEAPHSPRTPVATEQSLKGVGKWDEAFGALCEQEIPHARQRHHQNKTWNL